MHTGLTTSVKTDRQWTTIAAFACASLFVVLMFLAIVQYRWIAELRNAERRQLEASLKATAEHFTDDFVSELLRVTTAFQLEYRSPWTDLSDQLNDAYSQWVGSAPQPKLISDLLIIRVDGVNFQLYRFEPSTGSLQAIQWLNQLDPLKLAVSQRSQAGSTRWRGATHPKNPIFLEAIPALAVPFVMTESHKSEQRDIFGWSVTQLNRDLITRELLPALFDSYFAAGDPSPYRVAVATVAKPNTIVYQSEPISSDDLASPDLVVDLISEIDGHLKIAGPQKIQIDAPDTPQWRLFVKHRTGSLDAAVAGLRRRNLVIGAAILLMLAASAVLIVISAGRSRKLGLMQVEFAATVSHELRTPLAVIRAAAYNLEEGIVDDQLKVRHYGSLVQDAGRRLSKLVDQILMFAETQSKRSKPAVTTVTLADVVENAVQAVATSMQRRCPVERDLPIHLPRVKADPLLLSHCIQNLISNGIKYGEASERKPLKISAAANIDQHELQIHVADRGPGINQLDFPYIFEPFFRGKAATLDPAGTGLGLALVQKLMEKQHGRVSVETSPYSGTIFTLHLPIEK